MFQNKDLATQLIKSIFIPYFLVAIIVTLGQVYIEFKNIQKNVINELINTQSVFQDNLSYAYWTINKEGIEYNLKGIVTNSAITGIDIINLKGVKKYELGAVSIDIDKDAFFFKRWLNHQIKHRFPLRLETIKDKGLQTVAWAQIYTSNEVVFQRVKYGFILIFINSIIKTLLLWFIVFYFIKKIVAKPMNKINDRLSLLDFSNLKNIDIKLIYDNELSRFIATLNTLINHIKTYQIDLEEKIKVRTLDLEIKNQELELSKDQLELDKKTIEKLSITDGLTNLFNRRHFNDVFQKTINSAKRNDKLYNFLLIDIDYFKLYNDTYGHQMGDDTLVEVATVFQNSLHRADDYCFRLGGEEFGIIFKSTTKENSINFANIIRNNVKDLKILHEKNSVSSYVSISIGLFCKSANEITSKEKVYKEADELLYKAKNSGRDKVGYS